MLSRRSKQSKQGTRKSQTFEKNKTQRFPCWIVTTPCYPWSWTLGPRWRESQIIRSLKKEDK